MNEEQKKQFYERLATGLLDHELRIMMEEGYEPPATVSVVRAAHQRHIIKEALAYAALDGHLVLAWLLRRYRDRIQPDFRDDEDETP